MNKQELLDTLVYDVGYGEPGVVLMTKFDGGNCYASYAGMADIENNVPIDSSTVFNLASVSKQFTATCVHLLEKTGHLLLTDPVRKYLPELPSYTDNVQIHNLINHTSGLKDYIDLAEDKGVDLCGAYTPEQSLKDLCRYGSLMFSVGERFYYSNTNYFLLSIIVERLTGRRLSSYAKDNIFDPLEMTNTFYNESYPIFEKTARGYGTPEIGLDYARKESFWTQTGDGAVYSSAEDLMKWGENFDKHVIGDRKIVDRMTSAVRRADERNVEIIDYQPYGSGLFIQNDFGEKSVLHSGMWIGYTSFFVRYIDSKLTVAVLSNREDFNPGKVAYKASEIMLEQYINNYESQGDYGY